MTKIAIINYQAGNLRSVQKALEKVGANVQVTSEPDEILSSDGVVFPGQGACDSSMKNLRKKQLDMIITDVIKQGKPFLGVCLGMQLLLENSEEGNENCLGILSGKVRELPNSMKKPHMGWNQVKILRDNLLFKNIPQHSFFYFVHSFYSDPNQNEVVSGITDYGIEFCSALSFGNVNAVQFHPEKSGLTGLKIYENFLRYFVKG
tara:strand:- start:1236 stop:1850 length:615 start_codon:yes stop_codon:yes gene_type:complete